MQNTHTGKVRGGFGGMGRFNGGLRCKGMVQQCNYKYNYINELQM